MDIFIIMNLSENIDRIREMMGVIVESQLGLTEKESNFPLNINNEKLAVCSTNPITGFYRDGYCKTGNDDIGIHTVCAIVTDEFLKFTKSKGNNLDMLKPNDKWCLCAKRWQQAYDEGVAPPVIRDATNIKTLEIIGDDVLIQMPSDEVDEYARTLKNARKQGIGLRFPKSAVKANPLRFRYYNR